MSRVWRQNIFRNYSVICVSACLALSACGGSGGSTTTAPPAPPPTAPPPPSAKYVQPAAENLSSFDVESIIAQAVEEASVRKMPAVIAVTDRVGNVLGVFRMNGLGTTTKIRSGSSGDIGLQGVDVPHELAAIAKAITGSYLSSSGNAFSSRTASVILQQHFPPSALTVGLESGPLFGVQFSQLPCSDLSRRYLGGTNTLGPQRSPLGLSADPGGIPLYKNGVVVGGIGVSADGDYGFDAESTDLDTDDEELIAVAGAFGFAAPISIRADRINIDGTSLRFTDKDESNLSTSPAAARNFSVLNGTLGALVAVNGYFGASGLSVQTGQIYKTEASGIRPATHTEYLNPDVFVLTDGVGVNLYPPIAGTDSASVNVPLTQIEVRTIIEEAFLVMTSARAQIRKPLNSRAQVSISVVDTYGAILGIVRSPDAPIFGTDVSLQKARTATFFSNSIAGAQLSSVTRSPNFGGGANTRVNNRVSQVQNFLNDPSALTGTVAFADRSGGNLSRPYFPDGEVGTANGPLSVPISQFSPFAVGLQEELIEDNILEHVGYVVNTLLPSQDTAQKCTFLPDIAGLPGQKRLQNGIQIFPGSVPIYRNGELIGGIGVSGDGIDQDDMISFLGLHNAGLKLGTLGNADISIRADNITVPVNGENIRLRFVNCPFAPFLDSDEQNPCQGK